MTKKDYELIAQALELTNKTVEAFNDSDSPAKYDAPSALGLVATVLADSLERENPRFNRDIFLKACGVN